MWAMRSSEPIRSVIASELRYPCENIPTEHHYDFLHIYRYVRHKVN